MATKKKFPSKVKKSKKKSSAQAKSTRKPAKKIKAVTKSSKKPAKKKAAVISKPSKTKAVRKPAQGKATPKKSPGRAAAWRGVRGADSAGQSGDLQGLSNRERADSESVDELIEEGNAFEAGVISGVEEAGNREGSEVHTRQFPEDDVPGEYLDEE